MFTGIIQGVAEIVSVRESNTVVSVSINLPNVEGLQIGASVAINGVCLTVVSINDHLPCLFWHFQSSPRLIHCRRHPVIELTQDCSRVQCQPTWIKKSKI